MEGDSDSGKDTQGEQSMSEQERKKIMNLADTIQGEINRMCVTQDETELVTMAKYAILNIEKLRFMRWDYSFSGRAEHEHTDT